VYKDTNIGIHVDKRERERK